MTRTLLACLIVGSCFVGCAAQEDVPLTNAQVGEHAPASLQRARFLERRALTDLASYKRARTEYRKSVLLESAIDSYTEARDTFSFELQTQPGRRLRREYLNQELLRVEKVLDGLVRRRDANSL